jgi:D-mannonate dehydratase
VRARARVHNRSEICINFEEIKRFIAMYDSPSNTFFMDTGVATEWGREPAEEVIEYFGSRQRIGMVHFRNVVVVSPPAPAAPGQGQIHYIETFIDEGDADMAACMSALVRNGYAGGAETGPLFFFSLVLSVSWQTTV